MQNNSGLIADKNVVKNFYYSDPSKLNIRLETWKKYGTNKLLINDWIIDSIGIDSKHEAKLLDLGCGNGDLINLMSQKYRNITVYGLDISSEMVKLSIQKNPSQKIAVGDAEKLPFESDFFSYVVAVHLLHHIGDIEKAIKEMMRVTKIGGSIFIVTGNYQLNEGLNKLHYESLKELNLPEFMLDQKSYLRFTDHEATDYFKNIGIKVEKCKYVNNLCFESAEPAMSYYKSAMMYRNSKGTEDCRINSDQWEKLSKLVEKKVTKIILEDKQFIVSGEVFGYRISKKA